MPIPLIQTKLHRPPVATDHLHRKHLLDRLDHHRQRPLTLVSAPAGYGKSTLLSCWLGTCDIPCAWVSLDKNDNDLMQFLSYLVAAVQTIFPDACRKTRSMINVADMAPLPILIGNVINWLDRINKAFILVLDDYHLIREGAVHDLLNELLKYPPGSMHLVLATRRDPPLPLHTLRARSRMSEIRVQDLRFSPVETAAFLQQILKMPVDEATASLLEERTKGWVTALRLAALSLRHRSDLDHVLADLPADNRYVMDYIVKEVIAQQSTDMQKFLLTTSVLYRFCAPLCDVVCPPSEERGTCVKSGKELLKNLEQSNLFVVPLDDHHRWFRYHHLFQQLLQRRLKSRLSPNDITALHKQAGAWFAEKGLLDEAFRHVLSSGDIPETSRLQRGW